MSSMILIVVMSIAAEPAIDKLPEKAKQAITAYEKAVDREKSNLIDVLDKLQPETQAEIAAVKAYLKSIQGDKTNTVVAATTKKLKTSKLTRRKLGDSLDVLGDKDTTSQFNPALVTLSDGVLACKTPGQTALSLLNIKNAIFEFEYRLESSFAQTNLMVRHCYIGFQEDDRSFGCYMIRMGNGSGTIVGRDGMIKQQITASLPRNPNVEKPTQWNKMEAVLDGPEISVFINGKFMSKSEELLDTGGRIVLDVTKPGIELRNMKITMLE